MDEQLQSIFVQKSVHITVVASDDASTDGTPVLLKSWARRSRVEILQPKGARFGSAHRNFLRLIRDVDTTDADFFALADQDDVWLEQKLARAIACLSSVPADAYSSDVTAFWPDGSSHRIRKAQPQQRFDHLFGSPGPGCTFVLPTKVFCQLQAWVTECFDQLQGVWVHDWLIYAFVRGRGMRWYIDNQANVLYRQHGLNEIGANVGLHAALSRMRQVRSGLYRREVLAIADAISVRGDVIDALRRLNLVDRFSLMLRVNEFRRGFCDRLVLAVIFLVMPRGKL